jgi:hypothetical protein
MKKQPNKKTSIKNFSEFLCTDLLKYKKYYFKSNNLNQATEIYIKSAKKIQNLNSY